MKAKHMAMHEQTILVIEFKISIPLSNPFNTSSEIPKAPIKITSKIQDITLLFHYTK